MNVSGIKEIRVQMTKAEREFRELFRELGKKYGLSMHSRSSIYENRDDMIEIWREEGHMPQVICCKCGRKHDLDDPKCPGCGLKNPNYS